MEIPSLFKESRYGMPSSDQILPNRGYLIGYSYLFKQPRFGLQIIKGNEKDVEVDREDCFRTDFRIPHQFQTSNSDFSKSGFDKGHIVPSADNNSSRLQNSETFLLSNMAPQSPELNRVSWRKLESFVRSIALKEEVLEVFAISGPMFNIAEEFKMISGGIVVPHFFFKSILIEEARKISMQSWVLPNDDSPSKNLEFYLTSVNDIEERSGLLLWDKLRGSKIDKMKRTK
jgi:endonuclease G, mitochondrial